MSRLLTSVVVTVAVAGAVFAGTGVAEAAVPAAPAIPSLPFAPSIPSVPSIPSTSSFTSGPPVSCVTPALKAPVATIAGTVKHPVGSVQKDVSCLTGKG